MPKGGGLYKPAKLSIYYHTLWNDRDVWQKRVVTTTSISDEHLFNVSVTFDIDLQAVGTYWDILGSKKSDATHIPLLWMPHGPLLDVDAVDGQGNLLSLTKRRDNLSVAAHFLEGYMYEHGILTHDKGLHNTLIKAIKTKDSQVIEVFRETTKGKKLPLDEKDPFFDHFRYFCNNYILSIDRRSITGNENLLVIKLRFLMKAYNAKSLLKARRFGRARLLATKIPIQLTEFTTGRTGIHARVTAPPDMEISDFYIPKSTGWFVDDDMDRSVLTSNNGGEILDVIEYNLNRSLLEIHDLGLPLANSFKKPLCIIVLNPRTRVLLPVTLASLSIVLATIPMLYSAFILKHTDLTITGGQEITAYSVIVPLVATFSPPPVVTSYQLGQVSFRALFLLLQELLHWFLEFVYAFLATTRLILRFY